MGCLPQYVGYIVRCASDSRGQRLREGNVSGSALRHLCSRSSNSMSEALVDGERMWDMEAIIKRTR